MIVVGYKGNEYEVDVDWFVSDKTGRSGEVIEIGRDWVAVVEGSAIKSQETVLVVDPGLGIPLYRIPASLIVYAAPPDGEVM